MSVLSPLSVRLGQMLHLTDEEKAAIVALPVILTKLKRGQDVVREGDSPNRCFILLSGFVGWVKMTGDGKRQILAVNVAGDIPDLQSMHLPHLDSGMVTLSECEVAFVPHDQMRHLVMAYPRIGAALWRASLIDAAVFREWVVNVGSRKANSRVAHLICEIFSRLRDLGLADGQRFQFPMTQVEIGDATGLSVVHVNRTLKALRAQKLISLVQSALHILDWEELQRTADFDPAYLFLASSYRVTGAEQHAI